MEKKNKWEKHTAEIALADRIASNKVILLNGAMSVRQCGAADYLTNHHGYIQKVEVKQ